MIRPPLPGMIPQSPEHDKEAGRSAQARAADRILAGKPAASSPPDDEDEDDDDDEDELDLDDDEDDEDLVVFTAKEAAGALATVYGSSGRS